LQAIDQEIADLSKRPIDDEELKRAKDAILNSFVSVSIPRKRSCRKKWLTSFMDIRWIFWRTFRKGSKKSRKKTWRGSRRSILHREQMAVLVVGNVADFDKPLSSLGTGHKAGYCDSCAASGADAAVERPAMSD
jgi:zinc protease